ncbi:MAG: hypothetical protein HY678_00425 [Chloroflexi bacterium]|nr:hypothetical protein [Chloroflexota bacterium]
MIRRALAAVLAVALTLGLLQLLPARHAQADAVVAADDFESGSLAGGSGVWTSAWLVSADVLVVNSGDAQSGKHDLRLRGSGSEARRTVDLSTASGITLTFWAKADGFERHDTVSLFMEGAQGRQGLRTWVDREDDREYHLYSFAIPDSQLSANFRLEFVSGLDSSGDGFFIDDVTFTQSGPRLPPPPSGNPTGGIVLDSNFTDWVGMPQLADPFDDTHRVHADLHRLYWANRVDTEINYWMVERFALDSGPFSGQNGHSTKVSYVVHVDTNDNGSFADPDDRQVLVEYAPTRSGSEVAVRVRAHGADSDHEKGEQSSNDDDDWETIFEDKDWGDSETEGGLRVEFLVPWEDLGIVFGQSIRMFVTAEDDRLPDTGDVQWSPASILGRLVLGFVVVVGAGAVWYFRGRHMWRPG